VQPPAGGGAAEPQQQAQSRFTLLRHIRSGAYGCAASSRCPLVRLGARTRAPPPPCAWRLLGSPRGDAPGGAGLSMPRSTPRQGSRWQ
jgi:hypothetical protein